MTILVLRGGKGADVLRAGRGNDLAIGGRGADDVSGDGGDDTLLGRSGRDVLRGGQGDDLSRGGRGDDVLRGGSGNDTANGGSGTDTCFANVKQMRMTAKRTTSVTARDFRRLGTLIAIAVVAASCGSDQSSAPERAAGEGDEVYVAPLGIDFQVFGSQVDGSVRVGGSSEFVVSVVNVGSERGTWPVSASTGLDQGLTLSGVPASLDFTSTDEVSFTVTLTDDTTAQIGDRGVVDLLFEPPVVSNRAELGSATVRYTVVETAAVLGPVATADSFGASTEGGTFDPLANDVPGDAALDPDSLRLVSVPAAGSLTITGPSELTWVPDEIGTAVVAVYEVCDSNNLCTTTDINLWRK